MEILFYRQDTDDLRSTDQGTNTLVERLKTFWELGELNLNWQYIATLENGEPNFRDSFSRNNAKYHHNCASKYSTQKLNRILHRREKEKGKTKTATSTRSSQEKRQFATIYCAICNNEDTSENLHAAGSFHATNKDVNRTHNEELTRKWKEMALTVGNTSLLNLLSSGDLASNEIYYHSRCYKDMQNEYKSINSINASENMEKKWIKAQVLDEIVRYVIETEHSVPGSTFIVLELNAMYADKLKKYDVIEQLQTTRFKEKLLKFIPNLCTEIVDRQTVVLFSDKRNELVADYVEAPDDFFASLRTVTSTIRQEMLKQDNKFDGHFNQSSQIDSVPRTLLFLTSALINGNSSSDEGFDQASLTCSQLIVSHARKSEKNACLTNWLNVATVRVVRHQ